MKFHRYSTRFATAIVLMAIYQDNMDKPVPECQTILDFAAAPDDGGGSGDICSPSQITITTYQSPYSLPNSSIKVLKTKNE